MITPPIWAAAQMIGMPSSVKGKYPLKIAFAWDIREDGAPFRVCAMRTASDELWVSAESLDGMSAPARVDAGDIDEVLGSFGLDLLRPAKSYSRRLADEALASPS